MTIKRLGPKKLYHLEPSLKNNGIRNLLSFKLIYVLAFIFIVFFWLFSYRQINQLIVANSWVTHTYEVIRDVDDVFFAVIDTESRQRGYLVTGDKNYLAERDASIQQLRTKLKSLKAITQDYPAQSLRVFQFSSFIELRINLYDKMSEYNLKNLINNQIGINLFNKAQALSDHIRYLAQEIKSVELVLLTERNQAAIATAKKANLVLILGNLISLIFLLSAFILFNKELKKRIVSEEKTKNTESRLMSILEGAHDMIAALDKDYRYIVFNETYQKEFKRVFGKDISLGMTLQEALGELNKEKTKLLEAWKNSLKGSEYTDSLEFEVDKIKNTYEITSNLVINNEGETIGAIHIIRNISKRIEEQARLKEYNLKLTQGMEELKEKNEQFSLLVEMSDNLLACATLDELGDVISKFCRKMLTFSEGYLYIMHPSKNYLEQIASWGNPSKPEPRFTPDQCWAIRRGRAHNIIAANNELICEHIKKVDPEFSYLCIPLMAQHDIYGLFYMETKKEQYKQFNENAKMLINAFTELTALALANVRLRENLRYQSIRDPLTALYNRRYLEDFLIKQINQADRRKESLALLLLDLDHFKAINDSYGHDAGDIALKEVSRVLQNDIRGGDVAARYGGEEFVIVLYNINLENAKKRAESIRRDISLISVKYGSQPIGPITMSIGIAVFPYHGKTSAELIESGDKALYMAKHLGRNRVVVFDQKLENEKGLPLFPPKRRSQKDK